MGGGEAIAAKVAAIGVAKARLRGMQSMRKASRPVSAVVSSQAANPAEVAPLHTAASWEMDDSEFADDGLIMDAGEPTPRLVFSGVPSFQEAKDATSELKDAIDKVFVSSNSSHCGSSAGSQVSVLSPAHKESETKSCVFEATSAALVVPNRALQAFELLSGSPEAQTVVASIASDPNVWNAVIRSPVLKDFIQSQQKVAGFETVESSFCSAGSQVSALSPAHKESETKSCVFEAPSAPLVVPNSALPAFELLSGSPEAQTVVASIASDPKVRNAVIRSPVLKDSIQSQQKAVAGFEAEESPEKSGDQKPGFDFLGRLRNMRLNVAERFGDLSNYLQIAERLSRLSNYLQNRFGYAEADKTSGDNGNAKASFGADKTSQTPLWETLIALVVMLAMVVLVKRV